MSNDPIRQRLQALPSPPLPGDLWPRLLARREHARSRTRWLATAAGIVLAACALLLVRPIGDTPVPPAAPAAAPAGPAVQAMASAPSPDDAIAAIDRALQAAYARGATDADVAPIWEIRRRLAAGQAPSDGAGQS